MAKWSIQAVVCGKRVTATAVGLLNVTPQHLWDILTLPEGASIFRVDGRQLVSSDGHGKWEEQVVFTAPVRILFWRPTTRTRVHQLIDASNPQCITVDFRLLQSDLMSHLRGHWELKQLSPEVPGSPPVTQVTYTFSMWPKGVPTALRFMPGLLDAVKGTVKREAAQLLNKIYYVSQKVQPGVSVLDAVRQAAAEVQLSGGSFKLLQQSLAASTDSSNSSDSSTVCCSPAVADSSAAAVAVPAMADSMVCHELVFSDAESESEEEAEIADVATSVFCATGSDTTAVDAKHSNSNLVASRVSADGSVKLSDSSDLGSDIDADVLIDSVSSNVFPHTKFSSVVKQAPADSILVSRNSRPLRV